MHKRFGVIFATLVGLSGLIACTPAATTTLRPTAPPTRSEVVPRSTPPKEPPDAPIFVQQTGKATLVDLPMSEATAIARLDTPRATYFLLRAQHDQDLGDAVLNSVVDAAGNPLVSAVAGAGAVSQTVASREYALIIRIPGQAPRTMPTKLQWTSRGTWSSARWRGGYRQTLNVSGLDSAPIRKQLELEFAEAMAYWFDASSRADSFAAFAAARLRHKVATATGNRQQPVTGVEHGRIALAELMDFYTARSAIADSLQTQRGLQLGTTRQPLTESLALLEAEIHSTPSAAPPGAPVDSRCSSCAGIASYIPAESLAIEFATLKDLVQLPKLLDEKFGPLVRVGEAAGGSSHLMERYRQQLAIELDGFAETVGQFAVKNAAVVLSDPYLREGTALTLLFKAENPGLLQGVLESHLQRARHRHPDLHSVQEQIGGQTVMAHTTPDGQVRRFEYAFDDYRVVSNSRAALAQVIRTRLGTVRSLSQDPDYVAARRSASLDPKKERALLFFGNGFVANVVGPRSKILESRRMRAKAELQAVDYAGLLFGWMEGRRPSGVTELLQSSWLEKPDLTHFDGTPISWSPSVGAHSTWGYAQALAPIIDLPLTKVSKNEAAAYREFRSRYEAEMRGILDPTVLRFERTENEQTIAADLSVFPIPLGGKFNAELRREVELVGGGRIVPGKASRGISVGVGIGDDSPLRRIFDEGMLGLFGKRELSANFVGDWALAGLDEGSGIWDIAGEKNLIARVASSESHSQRMDLDTLLPKLPVWVAVHVRSRLLLTAAIAALRAKLDSLAPGLLKWNQDAEYRGVPITRVRAAESRAPKANYVDIYYAMANDVLLASLRRNVIAARIDEILDGRAPRGGRLPEDPAQWILDWAPQSRSWLYKTAEAVLDQAAVDAHERACAGLQLLIRGNGPLPTNSDERRALAIRILGYDPEPPQGGELQWQNGQCEGGHYGSVVEPIVPDLQNPDLLLHQVVSKIGFLRITLGTVQKQDGTELRARFESSHVSSHPSH